MELGQKQAEPFFIIGCPRSGTTLLQVLLNRHERIFIPPELKLFHRFHRASSIVRKRTIRRLSSDLHLDLPDVLASRRTSVRKLYMLLFEKLRALHQLDVLTQYADKTPEHTFRLPWIKQVYPNAKLIALLRDPRAVAASLRDVRWLQCGLIGGAFLWDTAYRNLTESNGFGNRLKLIRYETLISQPERVLHDLLSFLEIPVSDTSCLLRPSERDRWTVPQREHDWKWRAMKSIDPSRGSSWNDLATQEMAAVESLCRTSMIRAGYQPICRKQSRNRFNEYLERARIARSMPIPLLIEEFKYRVSTCRFAAQSGTP